jgi:cytochrome c1
MNWRETLRRLGRLFFGDSVRAFGTVSLLFLLSLAIAPAKDQFSEWRHFQRDYLRLIRGRADAVTLQRHFQPGLQQIWLPELGVVDRCTTCHVAVKEASLADVPVEPFRTHPPIPHALDEFGCVTCHGGQGGATTFEEAHHSTKAWEEPVLPAKYTESACGQCHLAAQPGTPQLNWGRQMLARYGCTRCHAIQQPDGTRFTPTDDPPSLEHVAGKTSREWIYAWIKDPQAYSISATMPNFGLSDDDARDLSAFLIAQSTPRPNFIPAGAGAKAGSQESAASDAGTSLYGESFCASCHAMQNRAGMLVGGDLGPELTRIGSKVNSEWLKAWLSDPAAYDPETLMPHYRFTAQQVSVLAGFLAGKTDSDLLANLHLPEPTARQIERGKMLAAEDGCAACHRINGIKAPENFAPVLSRIGSKPLVQLAFAEGVAHTLPDYIAAKIRNPRAFGSTLKMPQFKLSAPQIDALTTALLALSDRARTLPASLRLASAGPSHYEPAGQAGRLMNDLRCFSCHAINGRGGDMAPDLSWEGSSVQRKWLADFLKNPNTLRPALIRRMPRFNLTDAEITVVTDYMMTVYQTPAFDRGSLDLANFTPATVEQGRQLFYSKYACQSCHIADYKQDKGYIGPSLAQVGLRLDAAWIYHWLKDPQALRPGTIEPNQHLSDGDARLLTAFLVSLKSRAGQEAMKK